MYDSEVKNIFLCRNCADLQCCIWSQSGHIYLRTSFLVRVYLGSGICLWVEYSPLLISPFTCVRTVRISSITWLQGQHENKKGHILDSFKILTKHPTHANTMSESTKSRQTEMYSDLMHLICLPSLLLSLRK